MDREKQTALLASYALIQNDKGEILMIRRQNTSYMEGKWDLPAGRVDEGESPIQAAEREATEKVSVRPLNGYVVHVLYHKRAADLPYIHFYVFYNSWQGEPKIGEPHKCSEMN